MIIVDDHLALLALGEHLPDLGTVGPVATTSSYQFRLARALLDPARHGTMSRQSNNQAAARQVLHPPNDRLVVLDPRRSIEETVRAAITHRTNLLFAELLGAAVYHRASVRVTPANIGLTWAAAMEAEGIDFAAVDPGAA